MTGESKAWMFTVKDRRLSGMILVRPVPDKKTGSSTSKTTAGKAGDGTKDNGTKAGSGKTGSGKAGTGKSSAGAANDSA